MSPWVLILDFIPCWAIAVVGGYLSVVGLGNVRRHRLASQPTAAPRVHLLLQRSLLVVWDAFLLLLGSLLMVGGMVLFYLLVYE